ncbi:MAG: NADH-quinone oxidoreductase subunit NuoE family protein [Planctomycetota bacterium]|jgi:NADH-quinone oxidoreductase subunit E
MNPQPVIGILEKNSQSNGGLIQVLEQIQGKLGHLPEEALRLVAERTGRSLVDVFGVATFYRSLSLKPRGRHLVSVCLGTACHVNRAPRIVAELEGQLEIGAGETTADREFTLETVNCLGACALGPVVVVDGHYFPKVTRSKVEEILERARTGLDTVRLESDERIFPVEVSCARCNHSLMDPRREIDGRPSIRVTVSFGQRHGWLAMSSLYGSHTVESEYDIPNDAVVNMFCPHCHAELIGGGKCPECDAPMVPMIVRGGGIVQICTRRGCQGHMLDLAGAVVS